MSRLCIAFSIFSSLIPMMATAYDGAVGLTTIKTIRFQPSLTLVQVVNPTNPGNCPSTEYFVFRNENSYSNRYNSALLAAHAAGKKVTLFVTGCDNTWPVITEVWVH